MSIAAHDAHASLANEPVPHRRRKAAMVGGLVGDDDAALKHKLKKNVSMAVDVWAVRGTSQREGVLGWMKLGGGEQAQEREATKGTPINKSTRASFLGRSLRSKRENRVRLGSNCGSNTATIRWGGKKTSIVRDHETGQPQPAANMQFRARYGEDRGGRKNSLIFCWSKNYFSI